MLRAGGEEYKPDWVLVPGDVNSTVACALVVSKLEVKVAHMELVQAGVFS